MKFKKPLFVLLIAIFSITSCQVTEKIYLNEDGSGTFDLELNMSEMIKSLGSMDNKKQKDSTYVAVDTLINFSQMLIEKKDSIAKLSKEKQAQLEQLKGMQIKMHEDKNKGEFVMNYIVKFKNVNELSEVKDMLNSAQSLEKGKEKKLPSKSDMKFSFKRNKFKRIVIAKKQTDKDSTKYNESMKKFDMFMKGSTYNIEYHFPRPIKSTTAKNVTYSKDGKVIYIKSTMQEVTDAPEILNFEVKLKK